MVSNSDRSFIWSPALDVGNSRLNHEHREILALMARLQVLNTKSMSKVALLSAFDELIQYTQLHFAEEEEHMAAMSYPKLETHMRLHTSLLNSLAGYRAELMSSVYGRFPVSVFDFFKTWMISHIMIADKQYAEHQAQGLAAVTGSAASEGDG